MLEGLVVTIFDAGALTVRSTAIGCIIEPSDELFEVISHDFAGGLRPVSLVLALIEKKSDSDARRTARCDNEYPMPAKYFARLLRPQAQWELKESHKLTPGQRSRVSNPVRRQYTLSHSSCQFL